MGSLLYHVESFDEARWTLQLEHVDSVVVTHGLSCSMACGIFFPQPGIKTASAALQGGFLITGPPGKSQARCL